ncbi:DOMON-like domain-containing protein [Altericroceibacterium xinjiangense]|uniref:DOMON-like domain-containing protein n=1 Tax=Altericroceibacterium xinjiangense TaxID=762261 RepID=UPI000F7E5836|nr:DOMON-like domain-containing protein [Altericroceibacterium xinjiangense]
MQTHPLIPHPAHPPLGVRQVVAKVIGLDPLWLRLRWRIEGAERLATPAFAGKGRADGLWRTTCFELFLQPEGGQAYAEFNLSPSERWAAYDFRAHRDGMAERAMPREPGCTMRKGQQLAVFDAAIPRGALPDGACAMGLSAVIEETGGVLSYWALSQPDDKPDFHDPACFTGKLDPARAA